MKKCINCKYYGPATMVCFNLKNEGMRVFNSNEYTCAYFEHSLLGCNDEFDYGHNVNYIQNDEY